jgi:serine/threonine-protein kinase
VDFPTFGSPTIPIERAIESAAGSTAATARANASDLDDPDREELLSPGSRDIAGQQRVMGEGEERLGEIVGGRYQLRGILGRGGQSVIYRAKDNIDGDEVAIKILKVGDRDGTMRLNREAAALTSLGGTAAVRVLHQTQTADGAACLVTELLRGRDLGEYLADIEHEGGRMSPTEIVEIFDPIVKTLDAAHERGIVHRDLKPENIFVIHAAWGGGVRLLDFGFTRFVRLQRITDPHLVAGSPSYLAPEAWAAKDVDHRADVYGLGVLLYRVLAGQVPFTGRIHELLKIVRTAPRPSLHAVRPDLPEKIDWWVEHALAIKPEERFDKASALWAALVTCLEAGTDPPVRRSRYG